MRTTTRTMTALLAAALLSMLMIGQPAQAKAPANTTITVVSVSPRTIDVGKTIKVTGKASPNLKGKRVALQRLVGKKWVTINSATIGSSRTYSVTGRFTQAGRGQSLRVSVPATKTTKASTASAGKVTVYGWYYLSDRDAQEGGGWDTKAAVVDINGKTYDRSLVMRLRYRGEANEVRYGLARKCTTFRAVAGITDSSPAKAAVSAKVKTDDAEVWTSGIVRRGTGKEASVNITGALDLWLSAKKTNAEYTDDDPRFGWGDARIRCAF